VARLFGRRLDKSGDGSGETNMRNVSQILVIRLRELGDTLQTTPVLRQLRRLHPQAAIDVLCQQSSKAVLEHNRNIDSMFVLPPRASVATFLSIAAGLRRRDYDLIVDVQSLPKTAIMARLIGGRQRLGYRKRGIRNRLCYTQPHRQAYLEYAALQHLRLLQDDRVDYNDLELDFEVSPETLKSAEQFVHRHLRPPFAAIFGISRFSHRTWPVDKTAAIADRLAAAGVQPWLVYGPGQEDAAFRIAEHMRQPAVLNYPMPDFATLRAILGRAELFFGNDGGPKHAAVAAGIATVTVCSAVHGTAWAVPNDLRHRVVATRAYPGVARLAGTFTDADTLAEIPVSAAWQEVKVALQQTAAVGRRTEAAVRRAA